MRWRRRFFSIILQRNEGRNTGRKEYRKEASLSHGVNRLFLVADAARKYFPVQEAREGPKMAKELLRDQRMKGSREWRRRREGQVATEQPKANSVLGNS